MTLAHLVGTAMRVAARAAGSRKSILEFCMRKWDVATAMSKYVQVASDSISTHKAAKIFRGYWGPIGECGPCHAACGKRLAKQGEPVVRVKIGVSRFSQVWVFLCWCL